MAAFLLFVLAVAGGVTIADLVWENTDAGQITVFHHTISGYPEGWLLAIAAALGVVVALLPVASVNSTRGRHARRKQLGRLRRGMEHQPAASQPDHARLLDEFFGHEEPSGHLGRPAGPVDLSSEGPGRAEDHQSLVAPQRIEHHVEPRYAHAGSAHVREQGWQGRAEEDAPRWVTGERERAEYPPEPLYEQARRAAGLPRDWDLPAAASQRRRQ
jgi:hypothetical protein